MTVLVPRFQINDPMPTLGQLVREAIQPEPCKFRAFEEGDKSLWPDSVRDLSPTQYAEFLAWQIKGAAQGSNAEKVADSRPSPVAVPPFIALCKAKCADASSAAHGSALIGFKREHEWIDCGPDMPDLTAGSYEWRHKASGNTGAPKNTSLSGMFLLTSEFQYREIQP